MVDVFFFGDFDLASLSIWLFWFFFAGLVFYLQRENMREGYPLEDDNGEAAANQGPFPVPEDKTFLLPHGRGEVVVPSGQHPDRTDLALERTSTSNGFPFEPTGDPMLDGVGPASWAPRQDWPELDGHGHPKIVPLSSNDSYGFKAGRDPRGMMVVAADGAKVGTVDDMWIDAPEMLVRYLSVDMGDGNSRLLPMPMARIKSNHIRVMSIYGKHFADVPQTASKTQITLLEEEKIVAYYGGGYLYADSRRTDPQI
ncbi:photosynthetic reaction center subunit H [Roseobacteraceae bacterium S113]